MKIKFNRMIASSVYLLDVASTAFALNPPNQNMAECIFVYTIILFILLVSTISVNYQLARQETNAS